MIPTPQGGNDNKFAYGFDSNGNLLRKKVPVEGIDYKGRFGATTISGTEHEVSIGEKYFVCEDDGRDSFRIGDDVLISSRSDINCYMWGEIIGKDTVNEPMRLRVFIDDISPWTSTVNDWILQVVARPKPGIEKDTSLTSFDPTDGGPWTLTVTAGKFFPIGGTLLIKPTTDRSVALIGEVKAYSGTSLTVSLRSTNATVSQSYDSWSIALLDSPPAKLPDRSIIGLQVTQNATDDFDIDIAPGSVMDSTGTILLTLESGLTKQLDAVWSAGTNAGAIQKVALAGTISAAGTTSVTGTGTNFRGDLLTEAGGNATISEWTELGGTFLSTFLPLPVFGTATNTRNLSTATNDTTMSANASLTETSAAYTRNGTLDLSSTSRYTYYFVILIRKDSDGSIDVCVSSATPSGAPDIPAGYTYYRLLAGIEAIKTGASTATMDVVQPLYENLFPFALNEEPYLVAFSTTTKNLPNSQAANSSTTISFNPDTPIAGTFEFRRAALTGDVTASANSNSTTIASNAVTNTKLNDMAAYTLKGRNAGTTGDPSDISIPSLTTKASPATGDYVLITDGAASNAFKKVDVSTLGGGSGVGANYADYGLITDTPSSSVDYGTIV